MKKSKIQTQKPKNLKTKEHGPVFRFLGSSVLQFLICVFYILSFIFYFDASWAVPIISNVELTSISDNSMVVTWSTTNEDSSTEILWGSGGLTNITTGSASSSTAVMSGTTKYHYVELKGLYQNTTYQFRVISRNSSGEGFCFPPALPYFPITYDPLSFKTLEKPSGEYLFSFAVLNDLRYADAGDKTDSKSGRGIPYSKCPYIVTSEVADINEHNAAFAVINGNIADYDTDASKRITYNAQLKTSLKNKLESLSGASDLPFAGYKYLPVTGYHDKKATYTTAADDWMSDSMLPLTTSPTSTESRYTSLYGYNAASRSADSVFNYQFKYKYYNFIFLDALKTDASGSANLTKLYSYLSAESNSKTFIFMSYPGYDPLATATKDYPIDIPTSEVGGVLTISNANAFRATLEAFEDISGNPIVAAVISGHLGDNYKREINGISYVRQGPAVQYPTGYSIYKVYSTGYIKTFYKTKGRDAADKPYYEHARDQISGEVVSGTSIAKEVLTQFWLGSSSSRNFTYQYAFIPGLAPRVISTAPTSNEASVGLNSPLLINFNKRMTEQGLGSWVSIKDSNNNTIAVSSESFMDSSRTILKVSHADFTVDNTYEVTVQASKARDEGLTPMEANYVFSFNTLGGTKDESPPTASIDPIANNSSTDPFPNFTGIATDESRVITAQYRFDNKGSWASTEAVDGEFTGTTEVFQIKTTTPLSAGSHQIWLKTSDGAGNVSSGEGFLAYSFTVAIGDKPTTSSFKINSNAVYPGDPISTTPKIEIAITSNNSLESGRITISSNSSAATISTTSTLTFAKVDTNYYATHEVTSPLSDGVHGITVEAFDVYGNATTYEVASLYVQSAANATVQGVPLNYPNPFNAGAQSTTISYSLSKACTVNLNIFDLAGNIMTKKTYTSGTDGGKAGYNEVTWDGKSDAGDYVGNGIYIYLIIVDGKVIDNGQGKITVLKQ